MSDIAIKVDNLSKTFKLPHEKSSSIKSAVVNVWRRKKGYEMQEALKNVSFEVKKGEFFGIVGRNGSGKSTLLKLLAGIYTPTGGNINIDGKLTPFIELGVGFNPELSGRENVFLNGALLGLNRKEMSAMYDEIVEFAELERFMDQKLKNYSSGMQVRLAFSIAIRTKSDILLIDEVLAVGDVNFQKKCYEYFYKLKKDKQTVVLVTHDMSAVRDFCDRAILIHNGKLKMDNSAAKVAQEYAIFNMPKQKKQPKASQQVGTGAVTITACDWIKPDGRQYAKPQDKIKIKLKIKINQETEQPIIGITIKDLASREIFVTNTKALSVATYQYSPGEIVEAEFVFDNTFNDGTYTVTPAIASTDMSQVYASIEEACRFEVFGWPFPTGILQTPVELKLNKKGDNG